jgi:hypothetical protein
MSSPFSQSQRWEALTPIHTPEFTPPPHTGIAVAQFEENQSSFCFLCGKPNRTQAGPWTSCASFPSQHRFLWCSVHEVFSLCQGSKRIVYQFEDLGNSRPCSCLRDHALALAPPLSTHVSFLLTQRSRLPTGFCTTLVHLPCMPRGLAALLLDSGLIHQGWPDALVHTAAVESRIEGVEPPNLTSSPFLETHLGMFFPALPAFLARWETTPNLLALAQEVGLLPRVRPRSPSPGPPLVLPRGPPRPPPPPTPPHPRSHPTPRRTPGAPG